MQPDVGPSLLMCYMHVSTYVYIATEGRKLRAVAHLAFARSQKTEAGISGYVHGIGANESLITVSNKRDTGSERSLPVSFIQRGGTGI